MKKRTKRWLALTVVASLCAGSNPQQISLAKEVSDKTASLENTEEGNVFKVELDANGNIVSDNSSDLENQTFSWDNATVYFVLTDRFKNGDTSNDHSYGRGMQADGKTPVEGLDSKNNPGTFHGGDLKGMTEVVEEGYFNELGVNAIWITAPYEQIHGYTSGNKQSNNANTYPDPAKGGFPYYSYHGYWTLDYSNIDENMGTEEDFEKFVDACHEHGIRVVMDVVMNHVGYTTMQDAVDYGFDGALKGDWKSYYYGNATYLMGGDPECENYWDASSSAWSKWWGPAFVKANYPGYTKAGGGDIEMSLCGLPDVMTSKSAPEGDTPPILQTKWKAEGRYDKEQGELDAYFSRTGNKKQARYYIIKWLTDWVREYGVDGFRCDTAKHVDMDAWKDLKTEAVSALKEWREKNPGKPGAQWTDDFWMTGEAWGHGMGRSPYYDNGFDSMINFTFPKGGAPSSMEGTYSSYAEAINSDPTFNSLSYISSHDDCLTRGDMISAGTDLLLTPGAAQIYYGDESNRPIGWNDWFTSDYKDQRYRTDMNWDSMDQKVLSHWQKVGQFRNKHLSVGAGQHQKLDGDAYTFSRTYHLEEDDEDKVVCCLPGKAGTYKVSVGDVFEDGETITDFYSGEKYEVSGGSVSATCDANGVILLEGSGIVKASVGAKSKNKSATYSSDTIDITLKANKAKDTYYQINDGAKKEYKADDVITIGGDTRYEEETKITLTGISEDDGSELKKEVTYQRSKEPTVSDGEFCVKVKKSEFATAPNIFLYSNDAAETAYDGAWPGPVMTEDEDSEYWSYKNEEITGDACIILSLGATGNTGGTWRSTPDKAKGLVAKGTVLYTKDATKLEEMESGDPGKVTINYVDQDGNELKSIYRVGVVGKKYTTYPGEFDGYTLVETPDNATGTFEKDGTVTYVYKQGDAPIKTKEPTKAPEVTAEPTKEPDKPAGEDDNKATEVPKSTETVKKTPEPVKTKEPTKAPTSTIKPTVKPTKTPDNSNSGQNTTTVAPTTTKVPSAGTDNSTKNDSIAVTVGVNKPSGQLVNTAMTIEAKATGGSGKYAYVIYAKNETTGDAMYLQKSFSANNIVTWKPTVAGIYKIVVTASDETNGKEVTNEISFVVTKKKFTVNGFTVTKSGRKIKLKASASAAKGKMLYRFVIRRNNKVVKSFGYSTKGSKVYVAKKPGKYKITMYAKDKSVNAYITKSIVIK